MHCFDVLWNLRHFGSQRIGCATHLSPTICLHHYLPWWWLATGQNSVCMHLLRFDCSWGISIVTDHRPLLACNWHKSIQITFATSVASQTQRWSWFFTPLHPQMPKICSIYFHFTVMQARFVLSLSASICWFPPLHVLMVRHGAKLLTLVVLRLDGLELQLGNHGKWRDFRVIHSDTPMVGYPMVGHSYHNLGSWTSYFTQTRVSFWIIGLSDCWYKMSLPWWISEITLLARLRTQQNKDCGVMCHPDVGLPPKS